MKRPIDDPLSHIWEQAEVLPDEKEIEAARIEELGKIADNATLFTETLKRKLHVGILDVIDELLRVALHSQHTAPKVTACRTVLALAKECGVLDLNPITNFLNAVNDDLENRPSTRGPKESLSPYDAG